MNDTVSKIHVEELKIGMFVTALELPLHKTPFSLAGFYINKAVDVANVAKFSRFAWINTGKARAAVNFDQHFSLITLTTVPTAMPRRAPVKRKPPVKKPGLLRRMFGS